MRQEPHRLIFVDETGTTTKMTRLRGRRGVESATRRVHPLAIGELRRSSLPYAATA
jgi:hypothetical protein